MRAEDPPEAADSFEGLLLVAHPGLKDPNFRRTVVFLSMHDAEAGAFGFVINRSLDKTAADVLPEHDGQAALRRVPVYLGGPVGHDQLGFAQLRWDEGTNRLRIQTNLSLDEVAARVEQPHGVRAFVGYSGWSAGQLEGELAQKAWVLTKPNASTLQSEGGAELWFKIMASLGPMYKLLAAAPDDPALN